MAEWRISVKMASEAAGDLLFDGLRADAPIAGASHEPTRDEDDCTCFVYTASEDDARVALPAVVAVINAVGHPPTWVRVDTWVDERAEWLTPEELRTGVRSPDSPEAGTDETSAVEWVTAALLGLSAV